VITARTKAELREALAGRGDSSVGLVPTMGALHEGHLALIRAAREECDLVVASSFVNPAQFGEQADLDAYPRDPEADARAAAQGGVDILFVPAVEEVYPPGFATWVEPGGAADGLEGERRPGHFRGVATVCLKLFNLVRPRRAYFGRKDAQQVAVIKQLVRDLDLDLEIRVVPTVRDADGLAISSRNVRLSDDDRRRALTIPRALATGDADRARAALAEAGLEPEYVAVADLDGPTLAVAVLVGATRLIDNVQLEGDPA
jgi:pantoate--beta-alanine ligase